MLGSVLGHDDDFIGRQLHRKRVEPDRLLDRIPLLDDLQAAWFLLQNCAAPRANFCCAFLPPHLSAGYAAAHDSAVARCPAELLEQGDMSFPPTSLHAAQLARFGGLGFRPRCNDSNAAHWACWQDTLPVIHARARCRHQTPPSLARRRRPSAIAAAVVVQSHLRQAGYDHRLGRTVIWPLRPELHEILAEAS